MSTIAKRLACDWYTARTYVNKWEITKRALEDEKNTILDLCESRLYASINQGNTQDAKWLLTKKGKDRGYGDQVDVTGNLSYTVIPAKPPEESPEEPSADS